MPPVLSDLQMALMRAACARTRTTPCTILRNQAAADGWGGTTQAWTDVTPVGLLCRVAPDRATGRELVAEGRQEAVDYFLIAFEPGIDQTPTSLGPADRIQAVGQTFEVTALGTRTMELEHVARCVRIR